jgi:transposase
MSEDSSNSLQRIEVITSVERRRRWSVAEKLEIIEETEQPGMSVSYVARKHGISPSLLFKWRKLYREGALTAIDANEPVVAASEVKRLRRQVRELQRLLGKKTMEAEILKEAVEIAREKKLISHSVLLPKKDMP